MSDRENVINLPTPMNVLADRIRAAYERTQHGRSEYSRGRLSWRRHRLRRGDGTRQTESSFGGEAKCP